MNAESFQVHQQHFWIVTDYYFFCGDLARQAGFTNQLVIIIEEFFDRKALDAVDKRTVLLNVKTQVEEGLLAARCRLTCHAGNHVN